MTPRITHPPARDFHESFLWVRAMEIAAGGSTPEGWRQFHGEILDLFVRYRPQWRA